MKNQRENLLRSDYAGGAVWLGSRASKGIARVDRSLGERKAATVACGWHNGDWFETWSMQ